jgi:hypothetical protein
MLIVQGARLSGLHLRMEASARASLLLRTLRLRMGMRRQLSLRVNLLPRLGGDIPGGLRRYDARSLLEMADWSCTLSFYPLDRCT